MQIRRATEQSLTNKSGCSGSVTITVREIQEIGRYSPNVFGHELIKAIKRGDTKSVYKLIAYGTELQKQGIITARDNDGNTVLHWAARHTDKKLVSKLIKVLSKNEGISLSMTRNNDGGRALQWAAEAGHTEVVLF